MVQIGNDWDTLLADEFKKTYYTHLRETLKEEYAHYQIFPSMYDIFNALKYTSYSDVKVVILGQDPYHGAGQAHGLSFSVQKGVALPPSLQNIYKELANDVDFVPPGHGCLAQWAHGGVMLLNATLTVRAGQANSHRSLGWGQFTDRVIELLNGRDAPIVFLLWGAFAKAKGQLVTNQNHLVLTAAHPSPLSAANGFFGCRHFSKANTFLSRVGEQVNWQLQP